jgi:ABC-type nitrate/sulfonate/bicarbonate transport system substrate-binding protein
MANISTVAPYAGASRVATNARPNIFRRVFAALIEARQERADREIAEILARYADTPPYVLEAQRERARRTYPLGYIR